ncbi:hypothetical protein BDN70DRAFT_902093 [Pholiota conissans]|uniref:Uncharacterized protein n=1 Tax=Pholiota conissans TaxID=109636 RepID=A0A9P5YKJ0_9AGAR|nr:hypothetical protein BDN70DRAFT_902093 [Pholiota conissans]
MSEGGKPALAHSLLLSLLARPLLLASLRPHTFPRRVVLAHAPSTVSANYPPRPYRPCRPSFVTGRRPPFVAGRRPPFVAGSRPPFVAGSNAVDHLSRIPSSSFSAVRIVIRRRCWVADFRPPVFVVGGDGCGVWRKNGAPHPLLEGREGFRVMEEKAGHIPQRRGAALGEEERAREGWWW